MYCEPMTKADELLGIWSDFHKDYYGFRPSGYAAEQVQDVAWLQERIDEIHASIDRQKETFAGRENLREQGWVIEETDPVYIKQAKWLQEERDREDAKWMDN